MGVTCKHEYHWHASPCDEAGWSCSHCNDKPGEPAGYSPHLDRDLIHRKVGGILDALHYAEIIHVSNGCDGDYMTGMVAQMCSHQNLYDSVSIARLILELEGDARHVKFWRDQAEGVLTGNDRRHRCHCGALANWSRGAEHGCSEHMGSIWDDLVITPPVLS